MEIRKRTLVAIGTHDLDTLVAPFSYEVKLPHCSESFYHLTDTLFLSVCVQWSVCSCNFSSFEGTNVYFSWYVLALELTSITFRS